MSDHTVIKRILVFLLVVFLIVGYKGVSVYRKAYLPNVSLSKKEHFIYIPTGSDYNAVLDIFRRESVLIDEKSFDWAAQRKNFPKRIHPGRYRIKNRMSNHQLINLLRSGTQVPVKVTFNNIRTVEELADRVSNQIEARADSLVSLLKNDEFLLEYGFNQFTVPAVFIPNTYEMWWNTGEETFFQRMHREYKRFWNPVRIKKAEKIGLTAVEVSILASIVEEETRKNSEKSRVAGVYMNRLRKRMPLQADPTIKFAIGNFAMRRILKLHLQIESPFNTYKYPGLPPGPIRMPSIAAIESVLNYEKHDYLYFCARADFSGYHEFAVTLEQHNRNARLYRNALSKRRIYK